MRTRVLALLLLGCGGATEDRAPAGDHPVNVPVPVPEPSRPEPADPAKPTAPTIAPEGEATASRDGSPLYLRMCKVLDESGTTLKIWGSITDPELEVDAGIIALDVTPPSARGTMTCGKDVRVVFAEARGAEYDVDPNVCSVQLSTNALGQVEGHVKGEYFDTYLSKRHAFTLDFAAGDCKK